MQVVWYFLRAIFITKDLTPEETGSIHLDQKKQEVISDRHVWNLCFFRLVFQIIVNQRVTSQKR